MTEAVAETRLRTLWRWAGVAVLAVCLGFLVSALSRLDFGLLLETLDQHAWLLAALCSLAYAASLGLLAKAWTHLAAPGRKLPAKTILSIYGPGVVAKYLPGSVFQYASRHVAGAQVEMNHGDMARASLVEAALHVGIALGFAAALLSGAGWWAVGAGLAGGQALVAFATRPVIAALGWQLLFFGGFAAIVIALGGFAAPAADPARAAGYFFVAWTAGFCVPVAPGGIGVREAAFLALAAPHEGADAIILIALLVRVVGIVGDGLFGLAGYGWASGGFRANRQASG